MKYLKRILSVVLVISLFIGSFIGSFALFNHGTFNFDTEYLYCLEGEENAYYLQKADPFIIFKIDIDSSNENSGYSLVDSNDNPVIVKTERSSGTSFNILPPKQGYQVGESYTLLLADNAHFHNEDLKNARKLVFYIERPEQESYKFSDSVIQLDSAINEIEANKINISTKNLKNGDIVFGKNSNDEYVAYKVDEITDENTVVTSIPSLDEVFSELNLYGEFEWDVSKLVSNPELEAEIVENVKKSNFFSALMLTAYAEETPSDGSIEVSITPDLKTQTVEVTVKITLEPGKKGLFGIDKLRNQQVTLTLSANIGLSTTPNIESVGNWDVSATITSFFSWNVDITIYKTPDDKFKKDIPLAELFYEKYNFDNLLEYQKCVDQIIEQLNEITSDEVTGEIKLFDWTLPIPSLPIVSLSAEVKLFAKFEMAADINIGQEVETRYVVGMWFKDLKFKTYSNTFRYGGDIQLSLKGKAKVKAGVKIIVDFYVINKKFVDVSFDPQVGLYADLYVTIPIVNKDEITDNNFLYSYFEPGIYFSANVKSTVNLWIKTFKFSYELVEKKFPFEDLTFGNKKVAIGLTTNTTTVRATNNTATLPDILFKYFDVKSGINKTEKIAYDKLKFVTNDGTKLEVNKGKIKLPEATTSSSLYVNASYLHTDGKTYSTIFRIVVSGSILEGKVSAYAADLTTGALTGATVKLFASSNKDVPISSVTTDENGKFSFNVAKGNYFLEISAEGYRTLTSNQSVAEDEIKYTEHILLMDNAQSGMGSAGGTISNALDGKGISNVTVKLRNDWNNTSGAYVSGFETTTNSSGKYVISNVPVGYYTVEASLNGYVTGYSNIIVLSDGAKNDFDFTITPIISDDEIRIVLTWGSSPSDLDSHLIGKTPSGNSFNVYFSSKVYKYEGREMANLDVDDTSSYGPETITILENIYGTYTYAVHNYSNKNSSGSTSLSFSGAVVRVFMGSRQVAEYHVPTDQIGTYWTVFQIDGSGHILPINSVSNDKPIA